MPATSSRDEQSAPDGSPLRLNKWLRRGCGCGIAALAVFVLVAVTQGVRSWLRHHHPALSDERRIDIGERLVVGLWGSLGFALELPSRTLCMEYTEPGDLLVLDLDTKPATIVGRAPFARPPIQALVHRDTLYTFMCGSYAYVKPLAGVAPKIVAWDIRERSRPRRIGELAAPSNLASWCAQNTSLYVSMNGASGIADISDPAILRWDAGPWSSEGSQRPLIPVCTDIEVFGDHLLSAAGIRSSGRTQVIELDAGARQEIDYHCHFVEASDGYIYAICGLHGIATLDGASPPRLRCAHRLRPSLAKYMAWFVDDEFSFGDMVVRGPFGYLARQLWGEAVVDLSDPARPKIIAERFGGPRQLVFASNKYVCYTQPPSIRSKRTMLGYQGFGCGSSVYPLWENKE